MNVDIFARTEVGLVRKQNEDAYFVWTPNNESGSETSRVLLTVADGMGGHPGGEVASGLTTQSAQEIVTAGPDVPAVPLIQKIFDDANVRIRNRGDREPRYREMGTTLTAVCLDEGAAHVAHIGDTRLYWIRGSECLQITRDHTVAQELVDSGKLDPDVAEDHPMSNVLTRCLGVCPSHQPDVLKGALALEAGDKLLLASDGLVKTVQPGALTELVGDMESEKATSRLIEASLSGGAPDNVTVVLVRVISAERPENPEVDLIPFDPEAMLYWTQL